MFAQVIPALRLPQKLNSFTYKVPPEMVGTVKIGQIVEVPFRNKKTQAVIEKIVKTTSVPSSRLKSIVSILDDRVLFTAKQFKIASWLSDYYFVSIGLVIKSMLPAIPKRKIATKSKEVFADIFTAQPIPLPTLKAKNFFQYSKKTELNDFLYSLLKISKAQSLIIIPDLLELALSSQFLDKELAATTAIIHSGLNKNQVFNIWVDVLSGKTKIIIGTRQSVFLPFNNLENIIIKDETSDDLKQWDQNPRYDSRKVAEQLQSLHQAKLTLCATAPRLETFELIKSKKINLIKSKEEKINKQIVDLKNEHAGGNYSLISYQLENAIVAAKEKKQKVALYLNRRGVASSVVCSDCGYIFNCPHCLLPLPLHSTSQLKCNHCGYSTSLLPKCPNCRGVKFKFSGQGIEKLATEIKKLWPEAKILKLDNDSQIADDELNNNDIYLGTDIIFKKLNPSKISLVGILLMDNLLYIPTYQAKEKLWQILKQITVFSAETTDKKIILQTFSPDNPLFLLWQTEQENKFYSQELADRKELNYPPFSQITKLIYQSNDQKNTENTANQLYQLLTNELKNIKLNIQISEPQPIYTNRVRGRWRWVIIIRANQPINELLNLIPEDWLVDVDPINLL